jgi:hypothetical protein
MISEMGRVAAECLKNPARDAVWSTALGEYVCPKTPEGRAALLHSLPAQRTGEAPRVPPPINPQFKLVFLTAAVGTLAFTVLCVSVSLLAGRDPPPLVIDVIRALVDIPKIGFGAVVGLLGGKALYGTQPTLPENASRDP